MSLTAVTQGPGRSTAEPGREEKLASCSREGRDQEEEESGVVGEQRPQRRREEDEEEASRTPNTATAREVKRETPPRFWRSVAHPGAFPYKAEGN
ncbi:hypothetical protein NDU88_002864 [Pleurodeles waltl]|uniref:Uncharacterized protein n=1 Tax=Pleurodeles waltl TaxID=8319 RepID=A0AAV7W4E0_PLEWA|nr:hypothetical protein NDU88_002864 [Pleurodeles waltl]